MTERNFGEIKIIKYKNNNEYNMEKVNMLFNATILIWSYIKKSNRVGLYFETYNIPKQFAKESRFNITLCAQSIYE